MPLITDNIEQARSAYSALELRATSAESLASNLQLHLDLLKNRLPISFELAEAIRQHAVDREADNAQLQGQVQQALQASADIPLQNFIASLGMAAAVGEATMPDRTIPSVSATVQSHLAVLPDKSIGLRFFQAGLTGDPGSLSSTNIEIARVPVGDGQSTPRNLYSVLADTQSVYADPFWSQFRTAAAPPVQPATDLVVLIATILANTRGWSVPYLLQNAAVIGDSEKALANLAAAALPGDRTAAFASAVDSLQSLVRALSTKSMPVVGDLMALTAALDATARIGRTLTL